MKIWIDILTPKQLVFSEQILKKIGKRHDVFCTSRHYHEVEKLAKIRDFSLKIVGSHGGFEKKDKLQSSGTRILKLLPIITKFSPDIVISFASPEAARISFGLGIKHIVFCDSPHASAVMKLTMPLIQKLLIPKIIPKQEFSKFGIDKKDIITYNAIDAFVTKQRITNHENNIPFKKKFKKNILIRIEEEEASYAKKSNSIIPIIKIIIEKYQEENIVILTRYQNQVKNLKKLFGKKTEILRMNFDGKVLLEKTDIFIGSGGTMTAESALMGIPTISYNAIPNIIENFLVKKKLVIRETIPHKVVKQMEMIFKRDKKYWKIKSDKIVNQMEDPFEKLIELIKQP